MTRQGKKIFDSVPIPYPPPRKGSGRGGAVKREGGAVLSVGILPMAGHFQLLQWWSDEGSRNYAGEGT